MGARSRATLGVALALALAAGMLSACGGSDSTVDSAVVPAASAAEATVGASLLPPDGAVASATALGSGDMPPDAAASASDAELPPAL